MTNEILIINADKQQAEQDFYSCIRQSTSSTVQDIHNRRASLTTPDKQVVKLSSSPCDLLKELGIDYIG